MKKLFEGVILGNAAGFLSATFTKNELYMQVIFKILISLKKDLHVLKNTSACLLPPNLHLVYLYACSTFYCVTIISFSNIFKFMEYFPGSNKVNYPDRNNFTVMLTYVVGLQNFTKEKSPYFTKLMGTNLKESIGMIFLKRNIIFTCLVPVLYKLHMINDHLVPRTFRLSDVRPPQGTKNTPPTSTNERCPVYKVGFMTKY